VSALFAISFDYPAGMTEHSDLNIATRVGASSTRDVDVAEALADHDMIVVERHELGAMVTPADLDRVKVRFDALVSQLAGQPASGTELTVAGLPALSYSVPVRTIATGQSHYIVIFDGATQYSLNCQSTAAHRTEMASACRTALDTLHLR